MSEKRGLPNAGVPAPADKRFRRAESRPGRKSGGWYRSPILRWGVAVTLVLPEKVDSFLTRYASRSYYDDLLEAGVVIQLYRGGLLHTKSM